MKSAIKTVGLQCLTAPPVYTILKHQALRQNPVTILCYHTLRPDSDKLDAWVALRISDFCAQINMLRQSYDIVSIDDALSPAQSGTRPRVVLTFDDGEIGLIKHLLPIVQSQDLPVTVYVATEHILGGKPYWFDRVMNDLQGAEQLDIALEGIGSWVIGPGTGKPRWHQIGAVLEAIKQAPTEIRDALADQVSTQVGDGQNDFVPLQPMSVAQLQALASDPRVTIGAHSHGHELLDQLSISDAQVSVAKSRDLLRKWTGKETSHFAYPNGNYTNALMSLLDTMGFASATILEDRLVYSDTPRQALPRIGVGRYDLLERLKLRLVGI